VSLSSKLSAVQMGNLKRSALPAVPGREPRLRASRSEQGPERDVRASTGLVPSISFGKKAFWVRSKVKSVSGARYR